MIKVENLSKYCGQKAVIQNVDFYVERGETVAIFGPSGAGKTALMRILTAYTAPSEGTVSIAGYDVFTHSLEVRKRVGYLPETVPLYTDMTIWDYLDYVAALRKVGNRSQQIDLVLAQVELKEEAGSVIGRLPKDARQRVGLAQAIIHRPELLILDEPTHSLSPQQIIEIRSLIKSLAREYTLLLGTRNLSEAEQVCQRVLIMNKGRVVAEDTPAYLTARLEGGQRVRLQTSVTPANALEILNALEGVRSVSMVGVDTFDIECSCGFDCRPAVANVAVQNGWGLLALHVVDASLEDVYVELTANQ